MSEIKILLTGLVMEASALTSSSEGKKNEAAVADVPVLQIFFLFDVFGPVPLVFLAVIRACPWHC
jgi:hypothetical protein